LAPKTKLTLKFGSKGVKFKNPKARTNPSPLRALLKFWGNLRNQGTFGKKMGSSMGKEKKR